MLDDNLASNALTKALLVAKFFFVKASISWGLSLLDKYSGSLIKLDISSSVKLDGSTELLLLSVKLKLSTFIKANIPLALALFSKPLNSNIAFILAKTSASLVDKPISYLE